MSILSCMASLMLPRVCPVCRRVLECTEGSLCSVCAASLPRLPLSSIDDNVMLRTLWARLPLEHAFSLISYRSCSPFHALLERIKYRGDVDLARSLGLWVGEEAVRAGLAGQVDLLVPVPLARSRERERGYNQALMLAEGMGLAMGKPVELLLTRVGWHGSQTRLSAVARSRNALGIYRATVPDSLHGKRIALVDDVMTTGSTLGRCAEVILKADPTARLSLLTLAFAGD